MAIVARDYIEEKLRKAKSAVEDAEKQLAKLPDNHGFVHIEYDSQLDLDTRFAIQQLNSVQLNVDPEKN